MEIKLPNGNHVVSENQEVIDMYLSMGGVEVKAKAGRTSKPKEEQPKESK